MSSDVKVLQSPLIHRGQILESIFASPAETTTFKNQRMVPGIIFVVMREKENAAFLTLNTQEYIGSYSTF